MIIFCRDFVYICNDAMIIFCRDFVYVCNDAIDLNGTLVSTEQKEYHESLNSGFQDILSTLSDMFGEKVRIFIWVFLKFFLSYFRNLI